MRLKFKLITMEISHLMDIYKVKADARCFLYKPAFTDSSRGEESRAKTVSRLSTSVIEMEEQKKGSQELLPELAK